MFRAAVLAAAGFLISFSIFVIAMGWEAAVAEAQTYLIGAAGSCGALLLLFLWNLACAPYRIECDKHKATKSLLESVAPKTDYVLPKLLARKERFSLEEAACLLSQQPLVYGEISGPAAGFLFDIKQRILSGDIEAGGYKNSGLDMQRTLHNFSPLGPKSSDSVFDPKLPGAWVDRETLAYLADEYDVAVPGVTGEVQRPQ